MHIVVTIVIVSICDATCTGCAIMDMVKCDWCRIKDHINQEHTQNSNCRLVLR